MTSPQTPVAQLWFRRIAMVATLGIVLRAIVAFGVMGSMPQAEDGPSYSAQALQMLDGSIGYYYFPPGTALFAAPVYAVIGPSTFSDHLLGVILSSGFLLSGVWLCSVLTGWGRATFITAILLALYPHSVMSATQISSQPLTSIFLTLAIGLAIQNAERWSWKRWVGVALCIAAAMLTRPASLAVLAVFGLGGVVLWKRKKVGPPVLAGATALVVVILGLSAYPFMAHNATMGQGWTISTNNEWNLFLGNTPYTPDYKTGHFGQRGFDQVSPEARAYMSAILPHESPYAATREQRTAMRNAAVDYMADHPIRTLYRISNRLRGFWGMDYTAARVIQNQYGLSNMAFMPLLALEGGGYLIVIFLAISAPFLVAAHQRWSWRFILGCVIAIMVPYLAAFALAKYHLPAIPLLLPIAALAAVAMMEDPGGSWRTLRRSKAWWGAVALTIAIQAEHLVQLILLR